MRHRSFLGFFCHSTHLDLSRTGITNTINDCFLFSPYAFKDIALYQLAQCYHCLHLCFSCWGKSACVLWEFMAILAISRKNDSIRKFVQQSEPMFSISAPKRTLHPSSLFSFAAFVSESTLCLFPACIMPFQFSLHTLDNGTMNNEIAVFTKGDPKKVF